MAPYRPQAPDDIERIFEDEGFSRNDDIVPSRVGVPVRTGLSGEQFVEETSKFFDDSPLDPKDDAELIDDLTPA
jgi:hypothetical protein